MTDHTEEIQAFTDRIMTLGYNFHKKYNIDPNTIFMSNNIYWELLEIEKNEFREKIDFSFSERKVFGLSIKILGSEEGKDEMYVGLVEE